MWVMVVKMVWCVVSNSAGAKIVPLQKTTFIDEDGIGVLVAVHYQSSLKGVCLQKNIICDRGCMYVSQLTSEELKKKKNGGISSQRTTIIQYP